MQTEAPSRQGAFALVEPKNREPKLAWLELHLASEVPSQAHSDKCAVPIGYQFREPRLIQVAS